MAEISEKLLKKIEKDLNKIIDNLLNGGSTDPGFIECETAASLFKLLKELNLKIYNEDEISEALTTDNIFGENFLK